MAAQGHAQVLQSKVHHAQHNRSMPIIDVNFVPREKFLLNQKQLINPIRDKWSGAHQIKSSSLSVAREPCGLCVKQPNTRTLQKLNAQKPFLEHGSADWEKCQGFTIWGITIKKKNNVLLSFTTCRLMRPIKGNVSGGLMTDGPCGPLSGILRN